MRKESIPASVLKRYTIISPDSLRGRSTGEVALCKDGKVIQWFSKKTSAQEVARELARMDLERIKTLSYFEKKRLWEEKELKRILK